MLDPKDGAFGTDSYPNNSGDAAGGESTQDVNGFQSGDNPGSIDGGGKGVGQEQGFANNK